MRNQICIELFQELNRLNLLKINVKTDTKDIDIKHIRGVDKNISFKRAWSLIRELTICDLAYGVNVEVTLRE